MTSRSWTVSLYEVLGVEKTASAQEIKAAYKKKMLKMHPDKSGEFYDKETLFQVQLAWDTLRDPTLREAYDERVKEQAISIQNCIYNECELSEFDFHQTSVDALAYSMPCRCGGEFFLTKVDLEMGFNLISCSNCSAKTLIS